MNPQRLAAAFAVCLLLIGVVGAASLPKMTVQTGSTSLSPLAPWGISLAGPEFGAERSGFSNASPGVCGRDYTYNSERTVEYFAAKGVTLMRLPIRWERIQPEPGGDLNELELARLRIAIGWVRKHGAQAIVDLHNYGRYTLMNRGRAVPCVIDQPGHGATQVDRQHLADLWRRLAITFRDEPAIYAFGLMNEPHDMGGSDWKKISQCAVDAIRATGDTRLLLVAGDNWSKAHTFPASNGPAAWIADPADNVAYEAHCYFDRDGSGRYQLSYDQELARDPELPSRAQKRLRIFLNWCAANHARGFIGEYAVPGDDSRWISMLTEFQSLMRRNGLRGCYWAAGEWWGGNPLSIQPTADFRSPAPALEALIR